MTRRLPAGEIVLDFGEEDRIRWSASDRKSKEMFLKQIPQKPKQNLVGGLVAIYWE